MNMKEFITETAKCLVKKEAFDSVDKALEYINKPENLETAETEFNDNSTPDQYSDFLIETDPIFG